MSAPRTGCPTKERRAELADRARERGEQMSARPMAPEHRWTEDGLSFAVHANGIILGNAERFGHELLRVVAERDEARQALQEMEDAHSEETGERCRAEDGRDALGKALLKIRSRAARSIARSGPRTTERRLAKDIQKCALDALRDAGLLPEEDGAPTGRQEDRERP